MNKIDRIKAIYFDEENKAAQKCMDCQEQYNKQLRLLEELRQYEADYQRKFLDIANKGVQIGKINNYKNFINKLHTLIDKQKERVNAEKKSLEMAIHIWQIKRLEQKRLSKLEEKMIQRHRNVYALKEQKMLDEIALRQHRQNDTHN